MSEKLSRLLPVAVLIGVLLLTTLAYWSILSSDFVDFDDNMYVTQNSVVRAGIRPSGLQAAFSFTQTDVYWHPVTWLSHMLDCHLFGLNAGAHHRSSLIIHLFNVGLLYVVLHYLTGAAWRSVAVASLFAVHPIGVDSVAWIAQRKALLGTLFFLLTLLAYAAYCRHRQRRYYALTVVMYALGLMSKSTIVVVPCLLLLIDFWPLRRLRLPMLNNAGRHTPAFATSCVAPGNRLSHIIAEKIPLLMISAGSVFISFYSMRDWSPTISMADVPLRLRVANALVSYMIYMRKMVAPYDLAVYYPYPETVSAILAIGAAVTLVLITTISATFAGRAPYLGVGWLWFVGTLVPTIGLSQQGLWPALSDRWAYIPFIGLYIAIVWAVADWARHRNSGVVIVSAALAVMALAGCTDRQVRHWRNSITLFSHTVAVTSNNYLFHNNLGKALHEAGRAVEAEYHYSEALRIKPGYVDAMVNLGLLRWQHGDVTRALALYRAVLAKSPDNADALNNIGMIHAEHREWHHAIPLYRQALASQPEHDLAHYNLGLALLASGQTDDAMAHFKTAATLNPDHAAARDGMGRALQMRGHLNAAIIYFREAVTIDPQYAAGHSNLGSSLLRINDIAAARHHLETAHRLSPQNPTIHYNLALLYRQTGDWAHAVTHLQHAVQLSPTFTDAHLGLGIAAQELGRLSLARTHFRRVLELRPDDAVATTRLSQLARSSVP